MPESAPRTPRLTAEKLYSIDQARNAFARGLQLTWLAGVNGDSLTEKLSPALEPFKDMFQHALGPDRSRTIRRDASLAEVLARYGLEHRHRSPADAHGTR